jgi:WD40 repeat protein
MGSGSASFWEMPSDRELEQQAFTKWRPESSGWADGSAGVTAFSQDGRIAASGGSGNPARISLWDAQTGKGLRVFGSHRDKIHAICFSPDGTRIASASRDFTIRIWDVAKGEELHCLAGHKLPVLCVAWSPDGKTVLSGGEDDTLRLWNPDAGTETRRLEPDAGTVLALAYAPDGKRFVAATTEKILIWTEPFDKPSVKIDRQPLPRYLRESSAWPSSNMRMRREPDWSGPES